MLQRTAEGASHSAGRHIIVCRSDAAHGDDSTAPCAQVLDRPRNAEFVVWQNQHFFYTDSLLS
jgi:hypothetical protein